MPGRLAVGAGWLVEEAVVAVVAVAAAAGAEAAGAVAVGSSGMR